jgi:hypothetical protein
MKFQPWPKTTRLEKNGGLMQYEPDTDTTFKIIWDK